MKGWPGP
ncbi:unnamed protein product, partial [Allacma fusca]